MRVVELNEVEVRCSKCASLLKYTVADQRTRKGPLQYTTSHDYTGSSDRDYFRYEHTFIVCPVCGEEITVRSTREKVH